MQSAEYARSQQAHKKLATILSNMLRLHPTKPDLWIYAAHFAVNEHADMTEARSYMQRGLRFCKSSKAIWLEYAKLELLYIAKIHARRKILGLNETHSAKRKRSEDENTVNLSLAIAQDLESRTASADDVDEVALRHLDATPALGGAIPRAILDTALRQFNNDPATAYSFFELALDFEELPCGPMILTDIKDALIKANATSWQARACQVQAPLFGIPVSSSEFPAALRVSLKQLDDLVPSKAGTEALVSALDRWLERLLKNPELDSGLQRVVRYKRQSLKRYPDQPEQNPKDQ